MIHQQDPQTETNSRSTVPPEENVVETEGLYESAFENEEDSEASRDSEAETAEQTIHNHLFKRRAKVKKRWIFFGTLATIYVLAYCLVNVSSLKSFFLHIGDVLSPVVIGCILAYLLNPIFKFYEYFVFRKLKRKGNARIFLSGLCTLLSGTVILAGVVALILPELYRSISDLVTNYETYLNGLLGYIQTVIDRFHLNVDISDMQKLREFLYATFETALGSDENFIDKLLNGLQSIVLDSDLIGNVWAFLTNLFGSIVDVVIGIFIAFYILSSKEKRVAQIRKFRSAYLPDKQDSKLLEVTQLVDKTFGGFFKGVLLDSLIVGIVMYIFLSILNISDYNLLIATICAVTNFIPVFGPIIGAVPSGIIILITNPEKLLIFILLVLILQQLDGNILVPLIQGNNTGISSLAVLISITVMGGLFGMVGMIIGVPVFAVIIELCKRAIEDKLRKQNKDTDTTHYYRKGAIGNAEEEVYYEHAHWKYKYDHSRIKPHVDKALAAMTRIGKKRKTGGAPKDEVPSEETPKDIVSVAADVSAEEGADSSDEG
jgi:predicted PurR-regulated permease PerM